MKLTKSQLKKIIKEELDSMMQETESGDGEMTKFMQALKTIQSVLKKYDLADTTRDTYNPYDDEDLQRRYESQWAAHYEAIEQITTDPEYIKAKNYLMGLKVMVQSSDKRPPRLGVIDDVDWELGSFAASDVFKVEISDPNDLDKKGRPARVWTIDVDPEKIWDTEAIVSVKK